MPADVFWWWAISCHWRWVPASTIPASLALFRIGEDGKLEFARKYDVATSNDRQLFWTGFVSLP